MNDFMRESLSYFGLYWRMFQVKKKYRPEMVPYGNNKDQYFLYYEPQKALSDKIIVWVHGGGWNAGNPKFFDYVGQCVCDQGYRFVSLGYRLSPKYKYPCQIKDVCVIARRFRKSITLTCRMSLDLSVPVDHTLSERISR